MTDLKLQAFARFGAEARLRSLEEERQAIFGMFPELRSGAASRGRVHNAVADRSLLPSTPRRKRMSLAMRKVVGDRMRAYWATKRAERQRTSETADDLGTRRPKAAPKRSKVRKTLPKRRSSGSQQS